MLLWKSSTVLKRVPKVSNVSKSLKSSRVVIKNSSVVKCIFFLWNGSGAGRRPKFLRFVCHKYRFCNAKIDDKRLKIIKKIRLRRKTVELFSKMSASGGKPLNFLGFWWKNRWTICSKFSPKTVELKKIPKNRWTSSTVSTVKGARTLSGVLHRTFSGQRAKRKEPRREDPLEGRTPPVGITVPVQCTGTASIRQA